MNLLEINWRLVWNEIILNQWSSFFLINLLIVFGWPFGDNICSISVQWTPTIFQALFSVPWIQERRWQFSRSVPLLKLSGRLGAGRIWKVETKQKSYVGFKQHVTRTAAVDWWSGKWHLGWDLCRSVGGAKSYDKPRQHIKKQRHYFAQSYGFSSSHVWMWELDHNEGWVLKNWHFRTAVLEKTLESPLDSKDIIPVNPKGNQLWIVIWRIDA